MLLSIDVVTRVSGPITWFHSPGVPLMQVIAFLNGRLSYLMVARR